MLHVHSILSESNAHGPSLRSVLWLSGNGYRYPKSPIFPTLLEFSSNKFISVEEISLLLSASPRIEGISIYATDPIGQLEGLTRLCTLIKKKNLGIFFWGVPNLLELKNHSEAAKSLIDLLDVYIEGEERPELEGEFLWRVSSNQKVFFCSDRYHSWQEVFQHGAGLPGRHLRVLPEILKNKKILSGA